MRVRQFDIGEIVFIADGYRRPLDVMECRASCSIDRQRGLLQSLDCTNRIDPKN